MLPRVIANMPGSADHHTALPPAGPIRGRLDIRALCCCRQRVRWGISGYGWGEPQSGRMSSQRPDLRGSGRLSVTPFTIRPWQSISLKI